MCHTFEVLNFIVQKEKISDTDEDVKDLLNEVSTEVMEEK